MKGGASVCSAHSSHLPAGKLVMPLLRALLVIPSSIILILISTYLAFSLSLLTSLVSLYAGASIYGMLMCLRCDIKCESFILI